MDSTPLSSQIIQFFDNDSKNFPFTDHKECPYWMKSLLKKKCQLKQVGEVIRYLRL